NGNYYLEIQALTSSFELDVKEKSRSFQDVNMTYDELIGIILKDYPGYSYEQCIGEGQKIGRPLFQYKETDWSFLKRISSELKSELSCDIIETLNMFYFGRPSKTSYKLEDTSEYKACKDLKQYHESGGSEAGHDTDYFYYEIETREKYEIGANISFKNKDFYVNQYKAHALSDEVIYKYRLCRKNGVWQTKVVNSLIGGASIEGKVLEVKGEKIKLHLNIDKSQNKDKASWFPYAPPTGNVMYSMPIVGTSASLYFPSETSEDPIVTGCVRTNGSSCAKTADTTKRYFGTEHGSEIEMVPGALNIKGGSKEPLSISFDDAVGVTIKSHKKLSLNAAGGIIMKTPQSVKLKAQSQILVAKTGTKSGFSMETDLHFLSNNVIKNGSDREAFAAFDDEPTVGKKPEPKQVKKAAVVKAKKKETKKEEKKKGFNWGKLAGNVLAAVAVGTTAGAAAGMIMGGIGVAGKAISDCASGAVSDMSSYMSVGARESFVGALSGAIFGPYGAFKSYKGMMAFGGLTNGVESLIRQTLEGKGINFKTLLLDAGFGAATAGMFHGAGKLFQKTSPFVKKAFNKIASNISENTRIAKIAFANMDMPKDVKLACGLGGGDSKVAKEFVKQFKKAKNGIVMGEGKAERLIPGTRGYTTKGDPTKLGGNLMESMGLPRSTSWSGYQAQHIIPSQLSDHPIIKRIGMDMNNGKNGIFLPEPSEASSTLSRHRGFHKVYNDVVRKQLDKMDIKQSDDLLEKRIFELQQKLKKGVESGLPLYKSKVKIMGIDKFYKSNEYKRIPIWNRGGGATEELWERWLSK
ncbi:AHH domain-containing protein, partial [Clostridium estertheticum]